MRHIVTLCILLFSFSTQAAIELELTRGMNKAYPITILPFAGDTVEAPGDVTVDQLVAHDLQYSGQFRVLDSQGQTSAQSVNNTFWKEQGADAILTGTVKSLGSDRYQVNIQLINLYAGSDQGQPANTVLLSETFSASQSLLRALTHHISDVIYEKITGIRGIFSTKIAYVLVQRQQGMKSKYSLEMADVDGFNPQTLLVSYEPIMSPVWSPDGNKLAYVSFEGHRSGIYLQDLRTGQRQLLSRAPGINGAPAFSPNGQQLALVLTKTGNPKIYLLNLSDGQLTPVTSGWSIDTEPNFSPDGKKLLFTSNRDGTPQIYEYSFDGGNVNRITYTGNYNARGRYLANEPAIVMMHREESSFGIAKQMLGGGQIDVLVQTGLDESPSVAPNGKMVIYAMQEGGREVLAQVSTDGRIRLRLPAREGSVQEPAWSPFLN